MRLVIAAAAALMLVSAVTFAQSEKPNTPTTVTNVEALLQAANTAARDADKARAEAAHYKKLAESKVVPESSQAVLDGYHKSWIDRYEHEIKLRQHARRVLAWQTVASYTLLVVVVVITGLGVYLSFIEVKASMAAPEKAIANMSQGPELPPTELVVSFQKLQVTSAVTGVVILVLSLGFLYLFLDRVFELDPQNFSHAVEQPLDDRNEDA